MSSPLDRFKGLATAKASSGRVPNPELGKAWYLINQVRMKDNERKGGFRIEFSMTCVHGVESGKDADGNDKGPDRAGTKVSRCFFSGDRFLQDFKDAVLKCTGLDASRELDMANMLVPASSYPGLSELDRIGVMWEQVMPGKVCAFDPASGSSVSAGVFDGQVVVELNTVEKRVDEKRDKSKPAGPGNQVFDEHGRVITNVYKNSYFNRKVSKAELKDALGDEGIKRFFGTMDNFNALDD